MPFYRSVKDELIRVLYLVELDEKFGGERGEVQAEIIRVGCMSDVSIIDQVYLVLIPKLILDILLNPLIVYLPRIPPGGIVFILEDLHCLLKGWLKGEIIEIHPPVNPEYRLLKDLIYRLF